MGTDNDLPRTEPDRARPVGETRQPQRLTRDEWGDVVTTTPDPPNSGAGISVRAAQDAIAAYRKFRDTHDMPDHGDDQVFLIQGPVIDTEHAGTPVGWYAHLPQPAWWPPQAGDVVRYWNSVYLREQNRPEDDPDYRLWVNASGARMTDQDMLNSLLRASGTEHGYDPPALLVRGGKPYQDDDALAAAAAAEQAYRSFRDRV